MSMYGATPNGNAPPAEPQEHKAPQACTTCRKQKRKCSKSLPACALCERMNRHCDYSDASPPPTSEEFNALQAKVMELESRLNGGGGMSQPTTYPTPSSSGLTVPDGIPPMAPAYAPPQDVPWQGVQNRFPAIAFLDSESFKIGGVEVTKPKIEIPVDVLEIIGDGHSVQIAINEYFSTVHKWMPILSQVKLIQELAAPQWEADLALLFLCMKLITSRPQDGVECAHNPIYVSAKRFVALMEATGTASLMVLQANLLVTWYEYGQAIYPAAWMSAGWCLRYGNMLGINGHEAAAHLLRHLDPHDRKQWSKLEERRRAWWGVLLINRIISLGSHSYVPNSQEPQSEDLLPVDDSAWDGDDMVNAMQRKVSNPTENPMAPFPRLCQVSIMLGKVLSHSSHRWGGPKTVEPNLSADTSLLVQTIVDEANKSGDHLNLAAPLALAFSALCTLCDSYSDPKGGVASAAEAAAMQAQSVEWRKSVSGMVLEFSDRINAATPLPHDLDRINPIIMAALYSAAANYGWFVREGGDETSQRASQSIRLSLRRFGTRWRNAAEYLRILEAQELTYTVGRVGSS